MSSIGIAVMMSIGLLISSPIAGFVLLRSYEDFCKGVDRNSHLRIWAAFFGSAFLFMVLVSGIMRLVVKTAEKSISDYLLITCVAFPLAAALAGFALLQAYKIFQKGVAKKSIIRIWVAFLIDAALLMLVLFSTMKLVVA